MGKSSLKTWAGRLALVVLPPLLLLLFIDFACRVMDWGYPTSFLVADKIGEHEVWRTNEFYGYRFFQPLMARSPAPLAIDRAKPPGLKRVAVLGESAAMGDPLIEFSLARALDKILNAPGEPQRYEVINAGMTAISSPVVVDIAEELAGAGVDVFVVYTGNNEVVGPYSPRSVFQRGLLGRWFTPWHVRWTRTRLASAVQAWESTASPGKPWDGMAMFADNRIAASDPLLDELYANYENNLERIATIAESHGIEAVFCTMAVNLRDCPPFGSAHGRTLTPEENELWGNAMEAGKAALQVGDSTGAEKFFAEALQIDPDHAELNYLFAVAAEKSGDTAAAAHHYSRARDLDTLRVRTDSRMNELIRAVAARSGTKLVESAEVFGAAPGAESFVDHVHFSVEGVGLLAGAVAAVIEGSDNGAASRSDPATLAVRMGYDDWSRSKLASIMIQRLQHPPFLEQAGNDARIEAWLERQRTSRSALAEQPPQAMLARLEAEQATYPWDTEYAIQAIHRLAGTGAWSEAATLADNIRPDLRGASALSGLVSLVYAKAGRTQDAADTLLSAGPPYGYFLLDATFQLLETLSEMGESAAARTIATQILEQAPDFPGRPILVRWMSQTGS